MMDRSWLLGMWLTGLMACGGQSTTFGGGGAGAAGGSTGSHSVSVGGAVEACPEIDDREPAHEIYSHRVERAFSDDALSFTPDNKVLLEHASVPEAVVRTDGKTWVYSVNGNPGQHGIFIAELGDDGLLHTFDCVRLDGVLNGNAVDPDIVHLSDGRYRLFYFQGHFVDGPPPPNSTSTMYSAVSEDGIHFTVEGAKIEVDQGTDPTVVQLADGSWLMGIAGSSTRLAKSDDGETFSLTGQELGQGIPELATFNGGQTIRLYNAQMGLTIWESTDNGEHWVQTSTTPLPGADPSLVQESDGSYVMYFKNFSPGPGAP